MTKMIGAMSRRRRDWVSLALMTGLVLLTPHRVYSQAARGAISGVVETPAAR